MNDFLESAQRWKKLWGSAMTSFAHMCAEAMNDGDLKYASKYANRYEQCKRKFWAAFARETVALHAETPSRVDWFGEGR